MATTSKEADDQQQNAAAVTASSAAGPATTTSKPIPITKNHTVASAAAGASAPLSPALSVVWVFVTHGLVNACLLSPFNPVRCAYFGLDFQTSCLAAADGSTGGTSNMLLNWWSLHLLHVHLLLAALATTAAQSLILEQRLLTMTVAIIASSLSTGLYMLPYLNPPMAGLQAAIFVALLLGTAHQVAIQHANVGSLLAVRTCTLTELRSASFDSRRKLPLSTLAMAVQFGVVAWRVWTVTFGTDSSSSNSSNMAFDSVTMTQRCIEHAGVACLLWVALILGTCVVAATPAQQKALLRAHAIILFLSMLVLASEVVPTQDSFIEVLPPQTKPMVEMFVALVVSLVGSL